MRGRGPSFPETGALLTPADTAVAGNIEAAATGGVETSAKSSDAVADAAALDTEVGTTAGPEKGEEV